jgi:histidyl-tRNA synthetase
MVTGMNEPKITEILSSADTPVWQWAEDRIRGVVHRYGYQEIRLPILESARLYSEQDGMPGLQDSQGVILRPDGTPGCVKAVIEERGLGRRGAQRLWYQGPMFRLEAGRTQQFHQFGVEAFGMPGPDIDAEIILLGRDLLDALGLGRFVRLDIHTVGSWHEQKAGGHAGLETRRHFSGLCRLLERAGQPFRVLEQQSDGHGFYTRTVFDWNGRHGNEPLTLCNGGRYDDLAARCSGRALPAVGFALNVENLLTCIDPAHVRAAGGGPVIEIMPATPGGGTQCVLLSQRLRRQLPAYTLRNVLDGRGGEARPEVLWRVTVQLDGSASVWSRVQDSAVCIPLSRVADVIAGRVTGPMNALRDGQPSITG